MKKVLDAYRTDPTYAKAQKVRAHDRSHPMAACVLSKEDADLLANATHHANRGP